MTEKKDLIENARQSTYLYGRVSVYLWLMLLVSIISIIIIFFPYDETYIREINSSDVSTADATLSAFIFFAVISTAIFILGTFYNVMLWMEGKLSDNESRLPRTYKLMIATKRFLKAIFSRDFLTQLTVFIQDSIFLGKLWKTSKTRWFFHASILFGFIGLFVLDIVTVLALDIIHNPAFIDATGWGKLWIRDFGFDLFGLMVLIGLTGAIIRRFIFAPKQLVTGREDVISVAFLFFVILGGFLLEAIRISRDSLFDPSQPDYSFVGLALKNLLNLPTIPMAYNASWMIHATMSLAFIAYIPFSKLFHLLAAPLANQINAIIRRRDGSG